MKRIVVSVRPFLKNQPLQIYEDDKAYAEYDFPLLNLGENIFKLCQSLNITNVEIKGNPIFTKSIKNQITNLNKFDANKININLY